MAAISTIISLAVTSRRRIAVLLFAAAIATSAASPAAAAAVLSCDYNQNGICDAADYVNWRNNYPMASGATFSQGDGDGDQRVTDSDYNIWRSGFGKIAGSGSEILLTDDATTLAETATAPGCAGDYNNDGNCTDAADYVMWRNNVGMPGGTLPNDPTGANPIGQPQYNLWRANFGRELGVGAVNSSSVVGAVPEPSTALLAAVGALATLSLAARQRTQGSP